MIKGEVNIHIDNIINNIIIINPLRDQFQICMKVFVVFVPSLVGGGK